MMRPVAVWLALRYLSRQRANYFAAFVALASVAGVALGVAALIVVLSVMNGFENELRSRLVAITGHATVFTGAGDDWQAMLAEVAALPGVEAAAPFVELEAMAGSGRELAGVVIEGIDPAREDRLSGLASLLLSGELASLQPGSWNALLGRTLAGQLGVGPGDKLRLMVPVRDGRRLVTRLREINIAGLFEAGIRDHDAVRIVVHFEDAALLSGESGAVTGIRLRTSDVFRAPEIIASWKSALRSAGREVPRASDWTQDNASYFRAVKIEKVMMTLLLSLIVAVAAFNIVATLVMVVTDKRPGIAVLRTIGFSRRLIVAIFGLQGLLIGWAGVLGGVLGGSLLAREVGSLAPALERLFGFQFMPADVYYLTSLPSDLQLADVAWVAAIALAVTALATIYPAIRAAAVAPAEVLRYE